MMTKDEVIAELKNRNLAEVSRAINVTRSYLWSIAGNKRPSVSWDMVKKISDYLEDNK